LNNSTAPHCTSATPNIFTVNVENTTVDGSGVAQSAANVEATFSIANFGLQSMWDPSQWTKINVTRNPTTPPVTLNRNTTVANGNPTPLSTDSWFPVQPNASLYDPVTGHPHQCIMVTLDSTSGNVVFINNAAIQNMDFVNASKFERAAEINAKGYPARPDNPDGSHNTDQMFDLQILSNAEVLNPGQAAAVANQQGTHAGEGKRVVSQLTWTVHGCRHTGRFFSAGESKIEVCDPVGAFGYVIRHVGNAAVKDWNLRFTGPGLERVPGQPNTYRIHVPQDGAVTVTTHAEPKEQGAPGGGAKFAGFLDVGAGIPHGTFGNAFNTGFSLNAGLEYIATSRFSAEGIFGYHHFPAKVGSAVDLYQFSANGKFYLTSSGPFRPFVNGGIGGYKFSPGSTYVGGNFGAGILYDLTSHWGLQGSYNFHVVNTPGEAAKFSTLQAGIRFVF
jgi:opacity protein-like surface antigen